MKRIIAMLHRLMEAGLARQKDPDGVKFRPVVELTVGGVAVMKGEQLPPGNLSDLLPQRRIVEKGDYRIVRAAEEDAAVSFSGEEAERFEKLRNLRLSLARERQLPPYCICHESTLKLIARQAP